MEAEVSQVPEEIQFDMDEKTFILWQRIKAQNEYLATIIQLNETSKSVNSEHSEFQLLSTSTVPSEHDETLS
uniref:Uncharacterized protein n=1 Tax=Panagrolaimus sp. ES5 TaxID=591445 RepID=A0AC34GKV7_9BILA